MAVREGLGRVPVQETSRTGGRLGEGRDWRGRARRGRGRGQESPEARAPAAGKSSPLASRAARPPAQGLPANAAVHFVAGHNSLRMQPPGPRGRSSSKGHELCTGAGVSLLPSLRLSNRGRGRTTSSRRRASQPSALPQVQPCSRRGSKSCQRLAEEGIGEGRRGRDRHLADLGGRRALVGLLQGGGQEEQGREGRCEPGLKEDTERCDGRDARSPTSQKGFEGLVGWGGVAGRVGGEEGLEVGGGRRERATGFPSPPSCTCQRSRDLMAPASGRDRTTVESGDKLQRAANKGQA